MESSTIAVSAADGTPLHTYRWLPDGRPRAIVQVVHGMAEHAKRYERFAEALTGATYPKREVVGERDRLVQELAIYRSQAAVVAREALLHRLYGSHPYGRDLPTGDEVDAVKPSTSVRERQLWEGAMRLRYRILLEKGLKMMEGTVKMGERTGEGSQWIARARESLRELELALADEKAALAKLPFTEDEMRAALDKLNAKK